MKKQSIIQVILCLFLASVVQAKTLVLGEPLTLTNVTKVSEINSNPQKYLNKRVLIEGLIIDVCAKRGCWMNIASDVPFEKIQVKVVDGQIVFPLEAKGKTAKVEGNVEEIQLTKEQAIWLARHRAEENGKEFDPSTITGPMTYYRIRGIGAVIN